jgi:polysaccharide chain length determinant protein (PEP-CTERM system associated)
MFDLLKNLLIQFRGAWRYRWIAVTGTFVVALGAWIVIALLPNYYESKARIYVDSESVLKPLLTGLAVGTDVNARAASVSRVILSRPNVERVARETGIVVESNSPRALESTITDLRDRIQIIKSVQDPNLYTVSYVDQNATRARDVVETVITAFVEDTLGIKQADSKEAQKFLTDQIAEYEVRLREAEERLAEFKRKNLGMMPDDSRDYYTRLQGALTALEAMQAEYRIASNKRDELRRQLEGEEPTVGIMTDDSEATAGPPSSTDTALAQSKARLEGLLLQYTEKHPEVVSLRETIARLERERADQQASRRRAGLGGSGVNSLNINPVYQSMRIALSQTELQLADLRSRLGTAQGEVSKLRGMVNTIPEVEAELVRLNRDYEVTRQQHQALMQRLESARITDEADRSKDQTRFRIVEPATVPLAPVGLPRSLLNLAALLFALGVGLAIALVMHQLNPVFSTRAQVVSATGLPVFGGVTYAPSDEVEKDERRQPRLLAFAFGALLLLFVGTLVLSAFLNAPMPSAS